MTLNPSAPLMEHGPDFQGRFEVPESSFHLPQSFVGHRDFIVGNVGTGEENILAVESGVVQSRNLTATPSGTDSRFVSPSLSGTSFENSTTDRMLLLLNNRSLYSFRSVPWKNTT